VVEVGDALLGGARHGRRRAARFAPPPSSRRASIESKVLRTGGKEPVILHHARDSAIYYLRLRS